MYISPNILIIVIAFAVAIMAIYILYSIIIYQGGGYKGEDLQISTKNILAQVEVLYEKLMENVSSPDDYINKLYDFLEEFNDRYNQSIDMDQVLELCRKAKK